METVSEQSAIQLAGPMPYALITSLDSRGRPNAMGASWVSRVSLAPFLIMVSIAPERYSHEGIELNKEFVVCYPSAGQEKGAMICGTRSGRDVKKIEKAGLETVPSLKVAPPTIKDSTVAFECKVIDEHIAGDHTLFIGQVVAMTGTPDKGSHLMIGSGFKPIAMDGSGN